MIKIKVPGKWILCGEHAVIRGFPAIAFPHQDYFLEIEYEENETLEHLHIESALREPVERCIFELEKLSQKKLHETLRGTLKISNNIPTEAGFGSSAALCVGLVKFYSKTVQPLSLQEIIVWATQLEHLFHGKSSGLDIQAVLTPAPILFQKNHPVKVIEMTWKPQFTFHDTGIRSSTRSCVEKVMRFQEQSPEMAKQLDERMGQASKECLMALNQRSISKLAEAMEEAQSCYDQWGLTQSAENTHEIKDQMIQLKAQGALAVKMTGAGQGGFLVALWP